jgi:alkanesulfonate monooxygenase SsuD/methylene tetrahydromethanopterin reductase-like flavin-dependent oxidoreductase (luciferase family)
VVGVRGPRSLHLAAELADGVVLAEPVTPEYLASVREHTGPDLPIHAYNVAAVDDDADRARRLVRAGLSWIGEPDWAPHIQALPFAAEFTTCADGIPGGRTSPPRSLTSGSINWPSPEPRRMPVGSWLGSTAPVPATLC